MDRVQETWVSGFGSAMEKWVFKSSWTRLFFIFCQILKKSLAQWALVNPIFWLILGTRKSGFPDPSLNITYFTSYRAITPIYCEIGEFLILVSFLQKFWPLYTPTWILVCQIFIFLLCHCVISIILGFCTKWFWII